MTTRPTSAAAYCAACGCYHVVALVPVAGGEMLLACPVHGRAPYAAPRPARDPLVIAPGAMRPRRPPAPLAPRPVGRPRKAR